MQDAVGNVIHELYTGSVKMNIVVFNSVTLRIVQVNAISVSGYLAILYGASGFQLGY